MTGIKRHEVLGCSRTCTHEMIRMDLDGQWVSYADYDALQQRLSAAEQELATIKAQAEDATEYVLALENKALRAKLAATRAAAEGLVKAVDNHTRDCYVSGRSKHPLDDDLAVARAAVFESYCALAAEGTTGEGE